MQKHSGNSPSGILLFEKQRGITSFSSLSVIKKALGTGRVGHTGTLDRFADGLLVVLVGNLTRLVPYITSCDKKYRALIQFGAETDTLDPEGSVIATSPLPTEEAFRSVLPTFVGDILQKPPAYSAIHINGKRASDLARAGRAADLAERAISVYRIDVVDFSRETATIDVHCSKGTYIRCLARDIARLCGSRAHLTALRRTHVGAFSVDDAVCGDTADDVEKIRAALSPLTPCLASSCGLYPLRLAENNRTDFLNGRPLSPEWFLPIFDAESGGDKTIAVFTHDDVFAGLVHQESGSLRYGFVIGAT